MRMLSENPPPMASDRRGHLERSRKLRKMDRLWSAGFPDAISIFRYSSISNASHCVVRVRNVRRGNVVIGNIDFLNIDFLCSGR
jgi:hypothetical protein